MPATIKIKNSSTANAKPTSSDLVQGELAINVTDKKIFTEDSGGNIVELGANFNGFKNRIINGAMMIDQRNAGSTGTSSGYTVDRWRYFGSQATKITWGQNYGGVSLPAGFTKYLGFKTTTAYTSGATDRFMSYQPIEGFNIADLGWGTANAKAVTLSFQVYSSVTGTHSGAIQNSAGDRSYPFSFTVSSANTWTSISVTIAGDTSGTWATDNTEGLSIYFNLGTGSTYLGTSGAWAGAYYLGVTGSANIVGTLNNTFYITGVQLEKGSTATSFDYRPYGTELNLCYRYFQKFLGTSAYEALPSYAIAYNTTGVEGFLSYKQTMRGAPSLAVSTLCALDGVGLFAFSGASVVNSGVDSMRITYTGATGLTQYRSYYITANNSTSAFLTLSSEL